MVKLYFGKQETQESQETRDFNNMSGGINYYKNNQGTNILVESWARTIIKNNNGYNTYLVTSNILIQNLHRSINGTFITNYVFNDNFLNGNTKELVVYYIGADNKKRIKVTYLNSFDEVKVQIA